MSEASGNMQPGIDGEVHHWSYQRARRLGFFRWRRGSCCSMRRRGRRRRGSLLIRRSVKGRALRFGPVNLDNFHYGLPTQCDTRGLRDRRMIHRCRTTEEGYVAKPKTNGATQRVSTGSNNMFKGKTTVTAPLIPRKPPLRSRKAGFRVFTVKLEFRRSNLP